MHTRKVRLGASCAWISICGVVSVAGCGFDPASGTLDASIIPDPIDESQPYNNQFEHSEDFPLSAGELGIRGNLDQTGDVDVYDLGPMNVGDRVIVDMEPEDPLDAAIALFDEDGTSLLVNDHRNVYLGTKVPFIDVVIRRPTDSCYAVVSATPGYESSGSYLLWASKSYDDRLPEARPDVILLNFDGASDVRIGSRAPVDVPPFDAADISAKYEGSTDAIIELLVDDIREDYEGFDVTILSTSEGYDYEDGMSVLHFGTFNEELLGISDSVDEFNATQSQQAIIFTDTFAAFMSLDPSVQEMAQAIANVASHETGHLLGLVHTQDPDSIMDVTASLRRLLSDQYFSRSPLHDDVFPIGNQDAVWMLLDATGGDTNLVLAKASAFRSKSREVRTLSIEPPARERLLLSSCSLDARDHQSCGNHACSHAHDDGNPEEQ